MNAERDSHRRREGDGDTPCLALSQRSDFFFYISYGLWTGHTGADRVMRLMELAQWWLTRGNGKWARYAATAGREIRRREFPNAAQRARTQAMEQPCPAVVLTALAVIEEEYENLYIAHFAVRKEAV